MTSKDKGKYASKHPTSAKPDDRIATAVRRRTRDGKLSCASAEKIAAEYLVPMAEVGRTADLMEVGITACMLGFFGHLTANGQKAKPLPAKVIPGPVRKAIEAEIRDGGIGCEALWRIGQKTGTSRKAVGRICEALRIKVRRCQLGAF